MAVSVLPPCQTLPISVRMASTTSSTMPSATTPSRGGHSSMVPSISSMPITIVPPPTVFSCNSAVTSGRTRRSSTASSLHGVINSAYRPKPPSYPLPDRTAAEHPRDPSGDVTDQSPIRLPKLDSLPQSASSSNAKASSSDSILVRTSSNKVDSEISSQSKLESSAKDGPRGSAFPNFRILQRLATSARLRSAKKNALIHLNAKRAADKGNADKMIPSDFPAASDNDVAIHTPGIQKAFDKVDHDSGLSSLGSPTIDANDGDNFDGAFDDGNGCNESFIISSSKKENRARKKRPLSVKMRLKRRSSARRSKSKSSTPITASSIVGKLGSMAVPGLGPLSIMVEPTKVEIYSSRYNKRKQEENNTIENDATGVPQGSPNWSKNGDSNVGVRKLEANNLVTLRSLTQPSMTHGYTSSHGQALPGGRSRRKLPIKNKIRKIFLSEKQSSSIRDCGLMMPCAPPATPMPETLQNVEYIPSLSDLRSQRAIKTRLTSMEKEAKEKRQRRLDEAKKLERQLQRDHVALKKCRQRQEIYALNKAMTELEHKHFHEFCEQMKNVTTEKEAKS